MPAIENLDSNTQSVPWIHAVQSKAALHKATPKPAQVSTVTPANARLPALDLAAAGSTHTKMTTSDKSGKKSKKRKSET